MISTAFQLSPHYGTFRKNGGFYDIRFEREYAHPAARVWDAITDAEKLAQWFGGEAEIEPRVGGRVRIQLLMTTVQGTVIGIEPGQWVEYTWGEANSVRWEVVEMGPDRCKLIFTEHRVQEEDLLAAAPGWHVYLDRLAYVVHGRPVPELKLGQWEEIASLATEVYGCMLQAQTDRKPLVVENRYAATPERVWQALTDPEKMRSWYFDLPDFRPEVGFLFEFSAGDEHRQYLHRCVVTEVIPQSRLAYTWQYPGYQGRSVVFFDLAPDENGTSVRVTHYGTGTFPTDSDAFKRASFEAGWTYIFGTSMRMYLEN